MPGDSTMQNSGNKRCHKDYQFYAQILKYHQIDSYLLFFLLSVFIFFSVLTVFLSLSFSLFETSLESTFTLLSTVQFEWNLKTKANACIKLSIWIYITLLYCTECKCNALAVAILHWLRLSTHLCDRWGLFRFLWYESFHETKKKEYVYFSWVGSFKIHCKIMFKSILNPENTNHTGNLHWTKSNGNTDTSYACTI